MESDHHEGSINSSEEVKLSEQETDNLGVGRSYECVFCKRGFDTAQALGGHMNIHRKDKARNKPNSNNSFKHEQIYTAGPGLYHQMPSPVSSTNYANNQPANHPFPAHDLDDHHQRHLNYAAYFPGSASGSGPLYRNYTYHHQQYSSEDSDRDHRQPSNPLVSGDWRSRSSFMEDLEKNRMREMDPKEDLDLELRLGYDS